MTGPTDFCRNLAWAMALRGWTTCDLADRLCDSWNTEPESARRRIRRYLSGAQVPKLDVVVLLAEALRVFPKDLAFGDLEELHWGARMTLFIVHEWRGGNDSRATFLNLDHIVAVSDDLVPAKYPEETKTFLLLSTGARVVTLEPFSHLMIRLRLASLQHSGEDACELAPEGADLPIDGASEN